MENPESSTTLRSQSERNDQQQVILTHLLRVVATMRHTDELFSWLSQVLVQQFPLQAVQFWATQANREGLPLLELRGMACRDISFPQAILSSPPVVAAAERTLQWELPPTLQAVDAAFPQPITILFKRRHLNYYTHAFLHGNVLLPPRNTEYFNEKIPTPLKMVILFFLQQPPVQDFLPSINSLFQPMLSIAIDHSLLLPNTTPAMSYLSPPLASYSQLQQPLSSQLSTLIPYRIEDVGSSPVAVSLSSMSQETRRVYAAINNQKSIRELSIQTDLDMKTVCVALKVLLVRNSIQLYEPGGQVVENALLLNQL